MLSIAPSSPPSLFTVLSYTSNTITLKWAEPPLLDINGIVDRYVIKYHVKDKLGVTNVSMAIYEKNIPGNTTLNTTLEGLDSYTVYEISIAADTVDEGPSVTITQRTEEDGIGVHTQSCYLNDRAKLSTQDTHTLMAGTDIAKLHFQNKHKVHIFASNEASFY